MWLSGTPPRLSRPCLLSRRRRHSTRPSLLLGDEGLDDLDNLVLLTARQLGDLLEGLLSAPDGSGATAGRKVAVGGEEGLDADAEDAGEPGNDIGARWFVGLLPVGDVSLGLADDVGELRLGEAGGAA